jgi:type I restriction enzyme, S subunit
MSALPIGWSIAEIDDLFATLEDGRTLHQGWSPQCEHGPSETDSGWGVLKTTAIQPARFMAEHNKRLPPHLAPRPQIEVKAGDILITCAGPRARCGISCLVRITRPRLMMSGKMYRFRLPEQHVSAEYVEYYLQSFDAKLAIDHMKSGGSDSGLNLTHDRFRRLVVPLAPRHEQERIVAAIEEHLSRLDAGVAALERAREKVEQMKSAALRDSWDTAMAVAGGLSRVDDLLESPLANGRSVPDGPHDGFPVLRLTCVRDGIIDHTETKAGAWTAEQAAQYLVREGDFLVVRGNGSRHLVGRGGIVMRDAPVAFPDTLIRIRPHPARITARFLGLLWNSSSVREQLENSARTTAGIYKINQQSLGRIELPVPACDVQAKILRDADRELSRSHVLEAEIAKALARTSRLRSAILSTAFSGKLVPHDPSEEPASVLLGRIRAERSRSNGHKAAADRKPQSPRRKVHA